MNKMMEYHAAKSNVINSVVVEATELVLHSVDLGGREKYIDIIQSCLECAQRY